jgi:cupin superfamily acireductone dioxygenase involved in methionine salvage
MMYLNYFQNIHSKGESEINYCLKGCDCKKLQNRPNRKTSIACIAADCRKSKLINIENVKYFTLH